MPKYGRIETADPPIVAFFDTDAFDYPDLPGDVVELNAEDWDLRLTGSRWTITAGRLVAVEPSLAQQAGNAVGAAIVAGILATSASNPSLDAAYALDAVTLEQIGSVARDFASGMGLPGALATFYYPDLFGEMHAFTGEQIVTLYQAMRNYLLAVNTQGAVMRAGGTPVWPPNVVVLD